MYALAYDPLPRVRSAFPSTSPGFIKWMCLKICFSRLHSVRSLLNAFAVLDDVPSPFWFPLDSLPLELVRPNAEFAMVATIQPQALAIIVTFPVISTIFVALRVLFRTWNRQFKWGTSHLEGYGSGAILSIR